MHTLPIELHHHILTYLPLGDLLQARLVCTAWSDLAHKVPLRSELQLAALARKLLQTRKSPLPPPSSNQLMIPNEWELASKVQVLSNAEGPLLFWTVCRGGIKGYPFEDALAHQKLQSSGGFSKLQTWNSPPTWSPTWQRRPESPIRMLQKEDLWIAVWDSVCQDLKGQYPSRHVHVLNHLGELWTTLADRSLVDFWTVEGDIRVLSGHRSLEGSTWELHQGNGNILYSFSVHFCPDQITCVGNRLGNLHIVMATAMFHVTTSIACIELSTTSQTAWTHQIKQQLTQQAHPYDWGPRMTWQIGKVVGRPLRDTATGRVAICDALTQDTLYFHGEGTPIRMTDLNAIATAVFKKQPWALLQTNHGTHLTVAFFGRRKNTSLAHSFKITAPDDQLWVHGQWWKTACVRPLVIAFSIGRETGHAIHVWDPFSKPNGQMTTIFEGIDPRPEIHFVRNRYIVLIDLPGDQIRYWDLTQALEDQKPPPKKRRLKY